MKKLSLLFVTVLVLLASAHTVSAAQTVQYPAELEYYDAQIDLMLPRLVDFQLQYFAVNGRYYQALDSHASAPDVPEVPSQINASPTDQLETLALFWDYAELPDVLAWSYRIDTYSGPDGDGYVLTVSTLIDGAEWKRAINFGPDDWRTADWYLVIPEF